MEGVYTCQFNNESYSLAFKDDDFFLNYSECISDNELMAFTVRGKYFVKGNTLKLHSFEKSERRIVKNAPVDYAPVVNPFDIIIEGKINDDKISLIFSGNTLIFQKSE